MAAYLERAEKILLRIGELAAFSETPAGLTRTYGSGAFQRARCRVQEWMNAAGLQTRIDAIGNVRGRLAGGQQTLVIASHLDTVVQAGPFDGPLGVLMGLDLLEQLATRDRPLPFSLELVGFCDEEGVRFHTTYLGSQVLAGRLPAGTLQQKDARGISLAEAIRAQGGDPGALSAAAIPPADWVAYFEMHIEQGPVLYQRQIPAAVVTAIAGQKRVELTFRGLAGHAGTVPMDLRRDALGGAAEFVLAAEACARSQDGQLVATVGRLDVRPGASNVIPGEVTATLDLRSADAAGLAAAYQDLQKQARAICRQRHLQLDWRLVQESLPVRCDPALGQQLAAAIEQAGYEVVRLVSGAGHDAVPIASVAPVAMLFVRCFEGISHHPAEAVELADIAASLEIAENFLGQVLAQNGYQA